MLKKVYAEITNVCNLNCSFCPGTKREKRFMSAEDFAVIAPKIRSVTQYIYLHLMGEPLLHPQLKEILAICSKLDFKVTVTTNGTLLKKKEDVLLSCPSLYKVSISVHSFEANGSDGDFEGYMHDCCEFALRASQKGVKCAFRLWNLDGDNTKGENSLNGQILGFIKSFFSSELTENRRGYTVRENIYIESGEKFSWPDMSLDEEHERCFCYGLRDQAGVLVDGTVVPCCLDSDGNIPLGNLFTDDFETILQCKKARMIYDGFSNRTAVHELCRKCGYAQRFDKGE